MQVENNILVPYIMNKAVGLSPIIIIFAMLVGAQYLGILGLVISIPIATTAYFRERLHGKSEILDNFVVGTISPVHNEVFSTFPAHFSN